MLYSRILLFIHSISKSLHLLTTTSLLAQLAKNLPAIQETLVQFLGQEDPLEEGQATYSSIPGLALWLSKESACNVGDLGSIPGFDSWVGEIPGEGKDYPVQYSGPENSMDCIVYWVTKSWTWLSDSLSLWTPISTPTLPQPPPPWQAPFCSL